MEVAASSLDRDSEEKYAKYASAGIPQYVIVNLRDHQVEIHSHPEPANAIYAMKPVARGTDRVRLHIGNEEFLEFPAADLLP
jgi:Uma2 family endonuclease